MLISIRQETKEDHQAVFNLIEKAFKNELYSDQTEQFLVEKLRKSDAFVPKLSLVAVHKEKVVGFILLTKIQIDNGKEQFGALALAPVAVLPEFHGQGIGGQLIVESHKRAKVLGFERIVLLGHAVYYPRFGYKKTSKYNIRLPFDAPEENCMVISLTPDGLNGVNGLVVYSKPFTES